MKKNTRIFISISIFVIVATILVVIYFINKKSEKFNLTLDEKYLSGADELIKNGIIDSNGKSLPRSEKSEKFIKDFFSKRIKDKTYLKGLLKNPSTKTETSHYFGPFTPRITGDELSKARADHETNVYVRGLADAKSAVISGALQGVYNLITQEDKEKALVDLAINVGIGLLSAGLAIIGLGGAGEALRGIFGGGGPPPIDYNKIKKIVEEALKKEKLEADIDSIQINIDAAINSVDDYIVTKTKLFVDCYSGNDNDENIQCIKDPTGKGSKFLDINMIDKSTDIENFPYNRILLKNKLEVSAIKRIVSNQSSATDFGINFIKRIYNKNLKTAIALYPLFNIIIGMTLTYYQELMLVDLFLTDDKYFKNPWENTNIGLLLRVGKDQPKSTLLGEMQILCGDLFEYIKFACKEFNDSLLFHSTDHKKLKVDGLYEWTNYWCTDEDKIIPIEFYRKYESIYGKSEISDIGEQYFGFSSNDREYLMTKDEFKNRETGYVSPIFTEVFLDYLNNPLNSLQKLKKIAGIKWLKGEKNFNIEEYARGSGNSNTNYDVEYEDNGGYPFGLSAPSYKEGLNAIDNPKNYDSIEQTNRFSTFCTPDIYTESSYLNNSKCLNYKPSINKFDARIFNNMKGQDIEYNDNMVCEDLYADIIKSCLKPGVSPGKYGELTPTEKSRYTYCYNSRTGKTSKLINKIEISKCDNLEALYDLSSYISDKKISPFSTISLNNFDLETISDNGSSIDSKIILKDNLYTLNSKTTIYSNNARCKDSNDECKNWANDGKCVSDPLYTINKCQFSCGACQRNDIILRIEWKMTDSSNNIIVNANIFDMKMFPSCLMRIQSNTSYSSNINEYYPRIPINSPIVFNSNNLINALTTIRTDFITSNIIIEKYKFDSFITAKIDVSYKETNSSYRKTYFIFTSTYCFKKDNNIIIKISGVKLTQSLASELIYTPEDFYLDGKANLDFNEISFFVGNNWIDCKSTTQYPTTQYPTTQYPTTQYPTTQYPTTQYPTTQYPTTQYPTTQYPTTQYPTTQYPTTQFPITQYPTTQGICDPKYKNTCTSELLNNGYCVSQYGSCGKGDAWCNENSLWTSKCNK